MENKIYFLESVGVVGAEFVGGVAIAVFTFIVASDEGIGIDDKGEA